MRQLLKTITWMKGGVIQRAFERATRNPATTQAALLRAILKKNQDAHYGRKYHFAQNTTPENFARSVPINTFPDLAPYIEKMKRGERNILTSAQPIVFNLTSGTTDKPRYVPVTKRGMALAADRSHHWLYRAMKDHPSFLNHSIVCVSGAAIEGHTESGIPFGSASGMLYESLPRILRGSLALPFRLSEIKDYELRYYVMARMALEAEASFVVTPNPTTLIRLAETGIRYQEEIIQSIRDGVISPKNLFEQTPEDARILTAVANTLRPNRPRSDSLGQVVRDQGGLMPSACWKDLKLIGCWLGGSIGFQAAKLTAYYGSAVPRRDIGYLASEGCMTIPYEDNTAAGILALHNNYYEFIPLDGSPSSDERPLQCHEVEEGKQYKIILTNVNGLYRYDIHDIVEVQGFYNCTPVIAFVRKGDDMLNITGEKLHVDQVIEVFRRLKVSHGLTIAQFRVVANQKELRHEILIAVDARASRDFLQDTALPAIDKGLSEVNIEYQAKRRSRRLHPPCFHVMAASWPDDVRKQIEQSGRRDVQYKWRAMVNEMSDVDLQDIQYTLSMKDER